MTRPAIPAELKRKVLVEAGHRCAIPTCQFPTTEIAHIDPWEKVKEHRDENLIALCPNCHTRYDRGDIDRQSMLQYKAALSEGRLWTEPPAAIDPYRQAVENLKQWETGGQARFEELRTGLRARENPDRYQAGTWSVTYNLAGDIEPCQWDRFRGLLIAEKWHPLGSPLWQEHNGRTPPRPYRRENAYECWLGNDASLEGFYSHFWRAAPEGRMFLIHGHLEDAPSWIQGVAPTTSEPLRPGTFLAMEQSIDDVGAALLHARAIGLALTGRVPEVVARFSWTGLSGRRLQRAIGRVTPPWIQRLAYQDSVEATVTMPPSDESRGDLVRAVTKAVEPLYGAFDLNMNESLLGFIEAELKNLRGA